MRMMPYCYVAKRRRRQYRVVLPSRPDTQLHDRITAQADESECTNERKPNNWVTCMYVYLSQQLLWFIVGVAVSCFGF